MKLSPKPLRMESEPGGVGRSSDKLQPLAALADQDMV
jgi:hypothetical protein